MEQNYQKPRAKLEALLEQNIHNCLALKRSCSIS